MAPRSVGRHRSHPLRRDAVAWGHTPPDSRAAHHHADRICRRHDSTAAPRSRFAVDRKKAGSNLVDHRILARRAPLRIHQPLCRAQQFGLCPGGPGTRVGYWFILSAALLVVTDTLGIAIGFMTVIAWRRPA